MNHIPAFAYLTRLKGINARFQPVMKRISERLPASKREAFWANVVEAAWVGLHSMEVPKIVFRGSET